MIAAFFAPLMTKLIIGVVVFAALLIGWFSFAEHYENTGYQKAISAIAAKDRSAVNAVKEATKKVDECGDAGRSWNTARGLCE